MLKDDFVGTPMIVVKMTETSFKFYPNYNKEAIAMYLEYIKEKIEKKEKNYCGAV